ncbi:MAG: ABC transporter ATP-binding protein [Desulfobacteraceae bacterium]|jgi:subfamily B ATP-binding cassette protein MsbA
MKILSAITVDERHKKIFGLIKGQKIRLIIAMVCMVLMAATDLAQAWVVKPLFDEIFVNKDQFMLRVLPVLFIGIYFLRSFAWYGEVYLMEFVGQDIIRRLRNQLYYRLTDLPMAFFNQEKTGALLSRFSFDVNIVKAMVSSSVAALIRDALRIIFLTGYIFYLDWRLAVFIFVVLPIALIPLTMLGRRVRRASAGIQEAMGDMSAFIHETFIGTKVVKAFGMEAYEKKRFAEKTQNVFTLEMKAVIAKALASPIMEFLGGIAIAVVVWYGGKRIFEGSATPGEFFSFLAAVILVYDPAKKMTRINNAVQEGLAAFNRIYDIIDTQSTIRNRPDPIDIPLNPHRVRFNRVGFKYEKEYVLKDINLEVSPGETLALVGMSGGGKTSMVNLIPRFYDVSEGQILIDDIDIRNASVLSLRQQIAIVTQDPILFNDSIRNNIRYGKPEATDEEIIAASKSAFAYNFIMNFPKGFDTQVGELGTRLSGGEKQRLCIARALIKDAPILILDEATSSLDTEAEAVVQKALENLMRGRTAFVIAHRLSTIQNADRVIVLVNGQVAESGTHDALLTHKGEYYKLYQMQFRNHTKQP